MRRPPLARALAFGLTIGSLALAGACRSATAPREQVATFEVGPTRLPCVGEGAMMCLQVRERADAPYTHFHADIDGFVHERGYRYVLRVGVRRVAEPMADASDREYRLIRVLSRTATAANP